MRHNALGQDKPAVVPHIRITLVVAAHGQGAWYEPAYTQAAL